MKGEPKRQAPEHHALFILSFSSAPFAPPPPPPPLFFNFSFYPSLHAEVSGARGQVGRKTKRFPPVTLHSELDGALADVCFNPTTYIF